MIELVTKIHVPRLRGREITDFLSDCDDAAYQQWWPGTHLRFHTVSGRGGSVGSHVFMEELVGTRRIKSTGEVVEFVPGKRVVVQMRHLVRLPVRLVIDLSDERDGVTITHVLRVGYEGVGGIFDPLLRLWFTDALQQAMDDHVRTEFPLLRDNVIQSPNAE